MSKKLMATLAGIGASLAGVALWVLLSFVGFIAGTAGALIGILFAIVYQKIDASDIPGINLYNYSIDDTF